MGDSTGDVRADALRGEEGLVVLRSTVMDPFLPAGPPVPDHIAGLIAALGRAATASL